MGRNKIENKKSGVRSRTPSKLVIFAKLLCDIYLDGSYILRVYCLRLGMTCSDDIIYIYIICTMMYTWMARTYYGCTVSVWNDMF